MAAGAALLQSFCRSNFTENVSPDRRKRPNTSKQPNSVKQNISQSKRIQFDEPKITRSGTDRSVTHILSSYVDNGCMDKAWNLFKNLKNPDTFLGNLMIRGYANIGSYGEAIEFYHRVRLMGICPNNFTFPFVIKSCAGLLSSHDGPKVHCSVIKMGLDSDLFICNSLIAMYAKLRLTKFAEKVFSEMSIRDVVSWNSMINGYVSDGDAWKSLLTFREMQGHGIRADRFSVVGALAACSLENFMQQGKEIHCYVVRCGFESDLMIQTSLVDVYCKCWNVDLAEVVFNRMSMKNNVAWNAMIGGFALNEQPQKAFDCFIKMQEVDGLNPDAVTMVNLLPACSQLRGLLQGKSIHGISIRRELLPHLVLETALIDMYAKCRGLKLASQLFERITEKSLTSWNAMIAAYVHNGLSTAAINIFLDLQKGHLEPDAITIASVVSAYAQLASLREGKQIHGYVTKYEYSLNTIISNSIIYMYAKCGDLQAARKIFDGMPFKDVVSWNTIIMGYGIHGCGEIAIQQFSKMQETGIKPNAATFVSVLTSCSIAGLVDEGWKYFDSMQNDYSIDPQIEHYGCMIDLLGRTGNLDGAVSLIKRLPLVPTARIWGSLLAASRNNRNIKLAELAASRILTLNNDNTGCYILLSNMYAEAGRWEDVERVRSLMKKEGLDKTTGCSMIELKNKTCTFINGDQSHMKIHTIHDILDTLSKKINEDTYNPGIKFSPSDAAKKRASMPSSHSIRLALCFGLISTTVGTPILIKKNIRICDDCHHAVKLISRFAQREIVVGDSRLYHHFKDGYCCCGDYW